MSDLAVQPSSVPAANSFIDEWERQPNESAKAFKAFTIYRGMGDERGVLAVRDRAGGPYSHKTLLGWAEKHHWVNRALAYDRMLDRRRQRAQIEEIEAMARRQVQTGQVLQDVGLNYVKEQLQTPEQRAKHLGANAALRFIDRGVDLEREGLGMDKPEAAGDVNVQVNVLDNQTRADVFDKITQMAENMAAVERMVVDRNTPVLVQDEDIEDAELVEG